MRQNDALFSPGAFCDSYYKVKVEPELQNANENVVPELQNVVPEHPRQTSADKVCVVLLKSMQSHTLGRRQTHFVCSPCYNDKP